MAYPLFHPEHPGPWPMVLEPDAFRDAFAGESDHLELKQGVSISRVQETVVAFSNTQGGVLVAGVSPQGEPLGVDQPGEKAKDVHQAFRDAQNPGRYEVHELHVAGKVLRSEEGNVARSSPHVERDPTERHPR